MEIKFGVKEKKVLNRPTPTNLKNKGLKTDFLISTDPFLYHFTYSTQTLQIKKSLLMSITSSFTFYLDNNNHNDHQDHHLSGHTEHGKTD